MEMAANLQSRRLASFAKPFLSQIAPSTSLLNPSYSLTSRGVHVSVYDKNVEENVVEDKVQPSVTADDVTSHLSGEYWEPHPETGVFGPATDDKPSVGGEPPSANGDSVLEEKAFIRPFEDLDIPPPELQGETEAESTINKG